MPLLVFWPHAGAWGAGVILPPCAQLLWCELYEGFKKKKNLLLCRQVAKKAREEEGEGCSDEDEWPSPNGSGPVVPPFRWSSPARLTALS